MNRRDPGPHSAGYCLCCRWMRGLLYDFHGRDLSEDLLRKISDPAYLMNAPQASPPVPPRNRSVERRPSGSGVWV